MSLATWKAEFYPVEAVEVPADDAAAHSLRKWEGLRPEALERHGVALLPDDEDGDFVTVGSTDDGWNGVSISGSSCALCESFYDRKGDHEEDESGCRSCPLFMARGGISCLEARADEKGSPWDMWQCPYVRDPEPMIHWLRVTVEKSSPSAATGQAA